MRQKGFGENGNATHKMIWPMDRSLPSNLSATLGYPLESSNKVVKVVGGPVVK